MKRKSISKKIRFEIFKRDNFTCQYCGTHLCKISATIDHIHPLIKGGSSKLQNLTTSCKSCNSSKGTRTLEWFRKHCFYRENNIPKFTEKQARWLESKGFTLPCFNSYSFFYEINTLNTKEVENVKSR